MSGNDDASRLAYGVLMTQSAPWPADLTRITGKQVRRYRELRGMSAERLAEAVQAAGLPYTRTQVTNLESGRRTTITIGEVLVLAQVLELPPLLLIFPVGEVDSVEVLPGRELDTWAATKWFTGEGALSNSSQDEKAWTVSAGPIHWYRRHDEYVESGTVAADLIAELATAGEPPDEQAAAGRARWAEVHRERLKLAETLLTNLRDMMRHVEMRLPALPEQLRYIDRNRDDS